MNQAEFREFIASQTENIETPKVQPYSRDGFHYRSIQETKREQVEPTPQRSKIFTAFHTEEALDFLKVISEMKQGSLSAQEALSCAGLAHVAYVIENALKTP